MPGFAVVLGAGARSWMSLASAGAADAFMLATIVLAVAMIAPRLSAEDGDDLALTFGDRRAAVPRFCSADLILDSFVMTAQAHGADGR